MFTIQTQARSRQDTCRDDAAGRAVLDEPRQNPGHNHPPRAARSVLSVSKP